MIKRKKASLENKMNSNNSYEKMTLGKRIGFLTLGSLAALSGGLFARDSNSTLLEAVVNWWYDNKEAGIEQQINKRKAELEKQWAKDPETNPNLEQCYVLSKEDFENVFTPELKNLFSEAQGFKQADGNIVSFSGKEIYNELFNYFSKGNLDTLMTEFDKDNQVTTIVAYRKDGAIEKYFIPDKEGNTEEEIHFALAKASGDYRVTKYDKTVSELTRKIQKLEAEREKWYKDNPQWDDDLRAVPEYKVNLYNFTKQDLQDFMYGTKEEKGFLDLLKGKSLILTEKARKGRKGNIEVTYPGEKIAKYVEGYVFDTMTDMAGNDVNIEWIETRKSREGYYLIMKLDIVDNKTGKELYRRWNFKVPNERDFYFFHRLLSEYQKP